MKKLLLVALFVAVPAIVLAQATTTTQTKTDTKPEAKMTTTTPTTTTTTKTVATKPTETTPTTKTTATVETKTTTTTPETLIGEILEVNDVNKYFTLKVKDTGKVEKITFKSTDPLTKAKTLVKATLEKDSTGTWSLKKLEEVRN